MRNYESDAYRKYRSSMEQRQKVVRTSGSPYSQQTAVQRERQIAERSASTKRKRTREKGKPYYDYDLLLVIIFLMCFGLVMLYSSSAYSAQNDYNNDGIGADPTWQDIKLSNKVDQASRWTVTAAGRVYEDCGDSIYSI